MISLGIGDPDLPTPERGRRRARRRSRSDPATHQYPTNHGSDAFREAVAGFYRDRFRVELDPAPRSCRRSEARRRSPTSASRSSTPATSPLTRPRLSAVHLRARLLGSRGRITCRSSEANGFLPDLDAIPEDVLRRANLLFLNYPNNPTGAVVADGYFARAVELARANDLVVVHDNAYSEVCFDGYRAPSFLETPGAKEVGSRDLLALEGLEHDRLARRRSSPATPRSSSATAT